MAAVALRSRSKRRTMNEINMVPFIDVMLVLLIIFMVTAPLISTSVIDVPSVGKAANAPDQVIRVELRADHRIFIRALDTPNPSAVKKATNAQLQDTSSDAQEVSKSQLADKTLQFQNGNSNTPVVIFGDKALPYEEVIKVLDLLQKAGVQRVGLSVQLMND
jgi:biopolymer transport protein TolR